MQQGPVNEKKDLHSRFLSSSLGSVRSSLALSYFTNNNKGVDPTFRIAINVWGHREP